MSGWLNDADVALTAAEAGVEVVRSCYGTARIRRTGPRSDVTTDADIDAERAILGVISAARPEDGWTGEESGSGGGQRQRRWLVDPLCGTANFAVRTPLFAVNVALVEATATLAAVSADPMAGEVFWTDGRTALLRRDGVDHPLVPSATSRLVDVNCDGPTGRPSSGRDSWLIPASETCSLPGCHRRRWQWLGPRRVAERPTSAMAVSGTILTTALASPCAGPLAVS